MLTTVRQTPLCATLWSIFNSLVSGLSIVKCMLEPSCAIAATLASDSIMPVNIDVLFTAGPAHMNCSARVVDNGK